MFQRRGAVTKILIIAIMVAMVISGAKIDTSSAGWMISTSVELGGAREINSTIDPWGIISGKVTTTLSDQPLAGLTVTATSSDGQNYRGFAQTKSDGTYRIERGLGTGLYLVSVSQGSQMNQIKDIAVTAGIETANVNLTLDVTPSGTIKGRVTDTDNKPIDGASVSAGSGHDTTDSDGYYEISSGIPAGTYTVNIDATGYESASITGVAVTAGSVTANINFQLQKIPASKQASTITCGASPASVKVDETVTVSGAISPAVGGITVSLAYKMSSTEVTRQATTGNDGKYSDNYKVSGAGSWSVTASWVGNTQYSAAVSQLTTFTVTQVTSTGGLKVTVVDSGGKPLVGASISSTVVPPGQSALSGVTTSDGSTTFASVDPGGYTLQVSMNGYVTNTGSRNVVAGSTASVSITLQTKPSTDGTSSWGIPGYPVEALFIGIVISVAFMMLNRPQREDVPRKTHF